MNVQIKKTDAEEGIISALKSAGANTAILDKGLPTRRVEPFHYTDLRNLLKSFPAASNSGEATTVDALIDGATISFANNAHTGGAFPAGVTGSVLGAPTPVPADVVIDANIIGDLNEALVANGVVIDIAPNKHIDEPIILAHNVSGGASSALRFAVSLGAGSSATIVEHHTSDGASNHQNTVSNLSLAKDAKVTWVIMQEHGAETTRLAQLNIHLAQNTDLTILVLNSGGKLVRQEIHMAVQGEGSNVTIKGVNLIADNMHIDVTTTLAHNAPNTNADELFRNVLTGNAKGVFQGQIRVSQIAQKTDAKMACNTLLLSDAADFSAKPELEIFADDVLCGHGATVTDIDKNHLFYLRARGISEKVARGLLVKAFVEEVFEDLDNEKLGESLNARIENWLDINA
ncbi:MAG: Fe-S cluster assembly protein SufD [Rhizobiales bacterium]|nr:Fe-S cluster assembly protein SufD [Hyphomicrobiales bacterium]